MHFFTSLANSNAFGKCKKTSQKRQNRDFSKSETPESFKLRFVTPFVTICTRDSGRHGKSQDLGGIVQLVEQWNHNP